MPASTRQASPGPSALSAGTIAQAHSANPKKRPGPEMGDDARDVKKAKVDGSTPSLSETIKDKEKKKKKKKKKTRRTSVVLELAPAPLREREPLKARSSVVPLSALASTSKRKASQYLNGPGKNETEGEQVLSSSDKGKGRAQSPPQAKRVSPPRTESEQPVASGSGSSNSTVEQATEIACLKAQLASQKYLLERHQSHFVQHQQSLTCQICLDLMHKPYALAPCGHMTCYGCLVRWFTAPTNPEAGAANPIVNENDGIDGILNSEMAANGAFVRRRKSCPVCRAAVIERPIEMWGIKGMVASLVKSGLAELPLPAPANVDGAANTDPWRNVFRKAGASNARHYPFGHMAMHGYFAPPVPPPPPAGDEDRENMGWYDGEDGGIYRCIDCYHEIVYGRCTRCARAYPGHQGDDDDDDDDDNSDFDNDPELPDGLQRFMDGIMAEADDMDDESLDDEELFRQEQLWGHPHHIDDGIDVDEDLDDEIEFYGPPHRRINRAMFDSDLDEDAEPDDDDDDEDGEDLPLPFDYPHHHHHLAQMLFGHAGPTPRRTARIQEVNMDEEEEEDSDYEGSFIDDGPDREHPGPDVIDLDADTDSNNDVDILDEPVPNPRQHPQRRSRIHITVSSDDDDDEHEGLEIVAGAAPDRRQHHSQRRQQVSILSSDDDDNNDDEGPPGRLRGAGTQRPLPDGFVVHVDEDEDEDKDVHVHDEEDDEDNLHSEEDDSDVAAGSLSFRGHNPFMLSDDDDGNHGVDDDDADADDEY